MVVEVNAVLFVNLAGLLVLICLSVPLAVTARAQNKTEMRETKNVTSRAGAPLTLLGEPTVVGMEAPNFTAVNSEGQGVKLSDFKGKTVIISVFPSIDTNVCATQARQFNKRATELSDRVVVLGISKDLPFALGRFCAAEGIKNVLTLSDYMYSEFGLKYGFLIKENQLLARGVVVVDPAGRVAYVEYVDDIVKEPDYESVVRLVKGLK